MCLGCIKIILYFYIVTQRYIYVQFLKNILQKNILQYSEVIVIGSSQKTIKVFFMFK